MRILGIESSCDDTSVALLNCTEQGCFIISEKTASQIEIHKKYGGVIPEIAGRMHAEKIIPLVEEVMANHDKPDAIAVTAGPGLITGLIVGTEAARNLSYSWNVPLLAVNHIEGHIYSVELNQKNKIVYPALALIVSGGHTEIILIKSATEYQIIGKTKDDAAGECFDKVAKLLDLPYPGGPQISKLGKDGDNTVLTFPRPMIRENNYDFSFSGLKTSALYWLRDHKLLATHTNLLYKMASGIFGTQPEEPTIADFCASFEQAIVDVLVVKTLKAIKEYQPMSVILGGGVSANQRLRSALEEEIKKERSSVNLFYPDLKYCMDNAAMIAIAGYKHAQKNDFTPWNKLNADPNWKLA